MDNWVSTTSGGTRRAGHDPDGVSATSHRSRTCDKDGSSPGCGACPECHGFWPPVPATSCSPPRETKPGSPQSCRNGTAPRPDGRAGPHSWFLLLSGHVVPHHRSLARARSSESMVVSVCDPTHRLRAWNPTGQGSDQSFPEHSSLKSVNTVAVPRRKRSAAMLASLSTRRSGKKRSQDTDRRRQTSRSSRSSRGRRK